MHPNKLALGAVALLTLAAIIIIVNPSSAGIEPHIIVHHTMMMATIGTTIITTPSALTIAEFCRRNAISRAFYYKLVNAGRGPRLMMMGAHSRISIEAELDWKAEREAEAAAKRAAKAENQSSAPI